MDLTGEVVEESLFVEGVVGEPPKIVDSALNPEETRLDLCALGVERTPKVFAVIVKHGRGILLGLCREVEFGIGIAVEEGFVDFDIGDVVCVKIVEGVTPRLGEEVAHGGG